MPSSPSKKSGDAGRPGPGHVAHDLLRRAGDGRGRLRRQVGIDALAAVGRDVLRPSGAVPIAVLVAAGRVGVPVSGLRHAGRVVAASGTYSVSTNEAHDR